MSEMNSGGQSFDQEPQESDIEQFVASEIQRLDGELVDASKNAIIAQEHIAMGQKDIVEIEYNRNRFARLKPWANSLGASVVSASVALNFIEAPRLPAIVVLAGAGISYLSVRARLHEYNNAMKLYQARIDLQSERLYPLYIQGFAGDLPFWAQESLRSQGYPIPTYPTNTLLQDGENLDWS